MFYAASIYCCIFLQADIIVLKKKEDFMKKIIVVMTVMMMALFALPATVNAADGNVAKIGDTGYATLQEAIDRAEPGETIELIDDILVERGDKVNNQGIITITKDLTVIGNGHSVTATGDFQGETPSMFNVENGAEVTFIDFVINGKDLAKHGINVFTANGAEEQTDVTLNNMTVKNGKGYGVVCSGSTLYVNGLTTEGNDWGGVNVDCTDSSNNAANATIDDASIQEDNSVYLESSKTGEPDVKAVINYGSFKNVSVHAGATATLTVNGGEFSTDSVKNYLAGDLVLLAWSTTDDEGNIDGKYYVPMTEEDARLDAIYAKDKIFYMDAFDAIAIGGLTEGELEESRIAYSLYFYDLSPSREIGENSFSLAVPNDGSTTVQDVLDKYEVPPTAVQYDGFEFNGWWTIDEDKFWNEKEVVLISGPLDLNSVPTADMVYYSVYDEIGAGQAADEEAAGEGTKGDDEGKTSDEGPETGDDFNMAAMIAIMGVAAAAATGTAVYGRRKSN